MLLHCNSEPKNYIRIPDGKTDRNGLITRPVIIFRDVVVFPRMISPIFVAQGVGLLAIQDAQFEGQTAIALICRDPEIENPTPEDFYPIGVEIAVGRLLTMPDGSNSALVQGRRRVEVTHFTQMEPYIRVKARPLD